MHIHAGLINKKPETRFISISIKYSVSVKNESDGAYFDKRKKIGVRCDKKKKCMPYLISETNRSIVELSEQ